MTEFKDYPEDKIAEKLELTSVEVGKLKTLKIQFIAVIVTVPLITAFLMNFFKIIDWCKGTTPIK